MDREEARRRFTAQRVARLATVRGDGNPHAVPICFVVIGETIYSAIDDKPKSSADLTRLTNVATNPSASVLADHFEEDWSALWWVRADGNARAEQTGEERAEAIAALRTKYPQYKDHNLDGVVLAIDVTAWHGWEAAGVRSGDGTASDGTAAGGR